MSKDGRSARPKDTDGAAGVFRPYSAPRRMPLEDQDWMDQDAEFTRRASKKDRQAGDRLRKPPKELRGWRSRHDRQEWRMLEAARLHRLRADTLREETDGSFRPGFLTSPPRWLDRRSRKAWLASERATTRTWWNRRRSYGADRTDRERGAVIVAVACAALFGWWAISGWINHSDPAAAPAPVTSASTSVRTSAPTSAAAAPSVVVAAAAPTTAATRTVGPAGTPGQHGDGWQPVPSGGVSAIAPVRPSAAVPVASVRIVPAPTGAPSTADYATPQAAVAAWAARVCPSTPTEAFGAGRVAAQPLMTVNGWKTEDPASDQTGRAIWRQLVVDGHQTRRCGSVTVTVSPDQPVASGSAFVAYREQRVVTSTVAGFVPVVEVMAGDRRVVRQPGGRWLVDVATYGG